MHVPFVVRRVDAKECFVLVEALHANGKVLELGVDAPRLLGHDFDLAEFDVLPKSVGFLLDGGNFLIEFPLL